MKWISLQALWDNKEQKQSKTNTEDRRFIDYQSMSYYVTQIFHRALRLNAAPTWNTSPAHPTRQHGIVETEQHNRP